jgi:MFS family permease
MATDDATLPPQARRFIWSIVAAQVMVQIGGFTLPALLPTYIDRWDLTKTEAGWLIGIFFAAYVAAVPVLVSLTDRVPTRRVYVVGAALTALSHFGFALVADGFWSGMVLRAMAGIGWAGCYMPGLRAIADRLEGNAQSRAVSLHAAGVGLSGAGSFLVSGAIDSVAGPTGAFLFGGVAACLSFVLAILVMPSRRSSHARPADPRALLDFRPVFRNRRAMAWIAGYTVHTWELAALRAWGVTFLTVAAVQMSPPAWLPAPTVLFTAAGLVGIVVSISGNESAQKWGRMRIVTLAMSSAAILSLTAGWTIAASALLATVLVIVWNATIYLDSSALTAGTVGAADPALRGATMGLHSMCGYTGGFLGPLGVGLALDFSGDNIALGWGLGFGHLAVITLAGLFVLRRLGSAGASAAGR